MPNLAAGFYLAPASKEPAQAGLKIFDAIRSCSVTVREVVVDRGYSQADVEHWAAPLLNRGIQQIIDLKGDQRTVRPGPTDRTLMIDGGIYTDAIPEKLRHLPPPHFGMKRKARLALAVAYAARSNYEFRPLNAPDPVTGAQRFRGPAQKGEQATLRCANFPASLRSRGKPETRCAETGPCHCGITITVSPEHRLKDRQPVAWQSPKWYASYCRRTLVESFHADTKFHHSGFRRGFVRVLGRAKEGLLLAFATLGINIRKIRQWFWAREMRDPWLAEISDTSDPYRTSRAPSRRQKHASPALHRNLTNEVAQVTPEDVAEALRSAELAHKKDRKRRRRRGRRRRPPPPDVN
ncbi:hypothetical protein KZX45_16230 [Georgenia sp. EYE_87]|uniref:hypothetical protein n=1 Tax=Georgenia sp. EYE_87 TaxID=2853448 RepID=UPI002006D2EA|nr:hypothetical protein [Georgenia sp. EYE_87]MCK6212092.1 hypothetical protein [Georgenia sp. EYE_87]